MATLFQQVNQTSHLDPKGAQSQDVTFFDDFLSYATAGLFTTTAANSGTVAWDGTALGSNGQGDNVLLTTGTTQWNFAAIATTNALFLPVNSAAAMGCECVINWTSQASNNAAIFFGFMSTTSVPASASTPPTASYSGAIIYRLNGDTQWRLQTSNGSTKNDYITQKSDFLCADGTYNLRVDFMPYSGSSQSVGTGTQCFAQFSINGVQVVDSNNILKQLPVDYASLAAMKVAAIAQVTVTGTVSQAARVDYIQANKSRGLLIPNG